MAGRSRDRLGAIVAEHPGIKALELDVTDPASPDDVQILVENVRFLRFAEVNGSYDQVLGLLSGFAPDNLADRS